MAEVPPGFPKRKEDQARPWACSKENEDCTRTSPCPSCLGRRNRARGRRKQRLAQRGIGIPLTRFHTNNGAEENWQGLVRAEVKSGKQVQSLAARYLAAEAQSEAARAIGDTRPFIFLAMPLGWGSDGIVAYRVSKAGEVLNALLEMRENL